jgi:plasmid stabilization system protein ParE
MRLEFAPLAPLAYLAMPGLDDGLRRCAHGRCVIFFRPATDLVCIERTLHAAMDLSARFHRDADGPSH